MKIERSKLLKAGIPAVYMHSNIADLPSPRLQKSLRAYVSKFDEFRATGMGLVIYSPTQERTMALSIMAKIVYAKSVDLRFINESLLFDMAFAQEKDAWRALLDDDCALFIDDLKKPLGQYKSKIIYELLAAFHKAQRLLYISTQIEPSRDPAQEFIKELGPASWEIIDKITRMVAP